MPATIVAAVDRSPAATQAGRLLAGYQGDRDALSIVLVNVQAEPPGGGVAEGHAQLEETRALLAGAGLAVETSVPFGAAAEQIIATAARRAADAIVVGTRGHGMLRGFAPGSVALRVAHGTRSPVLLVQPDTRLPASFGRRLRVLVALDGSAHATHALAALLAREAWLGRLHVELAHVRPAPGMRERFAPPEQVILEQWGTLEAEQATRDARAMLYIAGRTSPVHEPAGDAALQIVRLAEETRAELIAMGTRGLGAVHHALVGSVALKVAIGSSVPVMLVP
jgi:nucleotide-binding universal stress UspA family protein